MSDRPGVSNAYKYNTDKSYASHIVVTLFKEGKHATAFTNDPAVITQCNNAFRRHSDIPETSIVAISKKKH